MSVQNSVGGGLPHSNSLPLSGSSINSAGSVTTNANNLYGVHTHTLPNYSGTLSIGNSAAWTTDIYYNSFDFSTKAIDMEKLLKFDEAKRKLVFDLLTNFLNCTDSNSKNLMYNTLEVYGVITEQKALERKVKISNIINEDKI